MQTALLGKIVNVGGRIITRFERHRPGCDLAAVHLLEKVDECWWTYNKKAVCHRPGCD